MKKIVAIIVTYKPNYSLLQKTITSLYPQLNSIIIVNNSEEKIELDKKDNIIIIDLQKNYGIAYAQNRGIEKAKEINANYILLSDQDTVYPSNYILSFEKYINNTTEYKADVFCPIFYDNIKNVYSPIMVEKFKYIKRSELPVYVQHAIASGTLINMESLEKIGFMDEALFIDYVDFEWCWRAVAKGFKILTIPSIVINHQLGDGVKKILNKEVTIRSDFRYYYILRNGYYLSFHCKYLTSREKLSLFNRTVRFSIGILLLRHNFKAIKICNKAFYRGVFKKLIDYDF